jgi:hypothetical protein
VLPHTDVANKRTENAKNINKGATEFEPPDIYTDKVLRELEDGTPLVFTGHGSRTSTEL